MVPLPFDLRDGGRVLVYFRFRDGTKEGRLS